MRITRVLAGSAAVITAVAGLGLAAAGPASAFHDPPTSAPGVWRAYGNTNPITSSSSFWSCQGSSQIGVNVVAQVCVVRSASFNFVQAAVIVRNNKPVQYNAFASMTLSAYIDGPTLGQWGCKTSGVAPHSWSVCFGDSVSVAGSITDADATGEAGNVDLAGVQG